MDSRPPSHTHMRSAGLHAQAAQKPLVLLLPTAATLFAVRELSGLLTMLVEVHREHMGRVLGEPAVRILATKTQSGRQSISTDPWVTAAQGSSISGIATFALIASVDMASPGAYELV